jgi:ATP-dependent Lon protease
VKAVGGVFEKAYGAKQAGITTMIIPKENEKDIPQGHLGLEICPVDNVEEALAILLSDTEQKSA